ncbi:DUF317 domain-containing protein [Streptomyces paromomycinus]|uniref:DUF317 domain-containing protein n=1 Tax=Streptomyces paromomycinus TaxID=92743 RepID=A0A401VXR3_STREY|nr:DUF317 domain-containing protein [Streptomyces paromomycinus]GCD41873.1 hypothetical protein GKJPGBOP_01530 [Streptomyces paromomycinus]
MKKHQQARWGPGAGEVPQQHYLVAPRHLAGAGDLRHITEYLCAAGWKDHTPRHGSPVSFENRDRTIRIGYANHIIPPMWTMSGGPKNAPGQSWHATFDAATPVEIIAGFTDTLTRARSPHAPDAWRPMTAQGWRAGEGQHPTVTSPDGSARLQFREEEDNTMWWAAARTTTAAGQHVVAWRAVFSENTPLHAIEGFAATLADPRPLLRPPGHVPFAAAQHATVTPYMVLPSQLRALQQDRVAAARTPARRTWGTVQPRPHMPAPAAYAAAHHGGRQR